jgi:hypothetical protein
MLADSENAALVWRRFRLFFYPAPDTFAHPLHRPINIASAPKRIRRAKPIEPLERRIMMSGGNLSTAVTGFEPIRLLHRY